MKISGGLEENGVVIGNNYDKYGAINPVVRWIMNGFESCLASSADKVAPKSIHEVEGGKVFG